MPTLTLDRHWLNLLSDGTAVSAYSADRAEQYANLGEVKHLAGGRQRAVRVAGEQGVYSFTFLEVSAADVDKLRAWKGETVQARNDRGVLVVGVFFQLALTEVRDRSGFYNVVVSTRAVTAPVGV